MRACTRSGAPRAAHGRRPGGGARVAERDAARRATRGSTDWKRPCGCVRRASISGDIYDIYEHRDNQTVLAFGDVSGKGAAAALYGGAGERPVAYPGAAQPASAALLRALNEALIVDARWKRVM